MINQNRYNGQFFANNKSKYGETTRENEKERIEAINKIPADAWADKVANEIYELERQAYTSIENDREAYGLGFFGADPRKNRR